MFFSVIVPIYKVEKYLVRCIESVLSQTFTDFELILVDDGSPDNCPEICDKYAKRDKRINVVHKENGGLVSARQAGISVAKGEYIFNLDADDAVENDALESAFEIIKSTGADIVSFSHKYYYADGSKSEAVEDILPEGLYEKSDIEKDIYPVLLANKNMQHTFYFSWGRALRRSLATENQLNVSRKITIGEDVMCIVPCFLQAEKVYMSHKSVYLYTIRDDSMSVSSFSRQMQQLDVLVRNLRQRDISALKDSKEQFSRYCCFMCFALLASAAEGNAFEIIEEIKNIILNSDFADELPKAEFEGISIKSRISIFLLKRKQIKLSFYFLYICNEIKRIIKKVAKRS